MRLGRVSIVCSYIVDLDNQDMVDLAREMVCEDIDMACRHNDELLSYIEYIEDSSLTEQDINSNIQEILTGYGDDEY